MKTLREEIDLLRVEVEAARKELEIKEGALAWLQTRLSGSAADLTGPQVVMHAGIIDLSAIEEPDTTKKRTLVDEVKDVTSRLGDQEFTVASIEAVFKKLGIPVNAKNPRAGISVALGKLHDKGWLVVTFEGKGNTPNRYKVASIADSKRTKEETPEQ